MRLAEGRVAVPVALLLIAVGVGLGSAGRPFGAPAVPRPWALLVRALPVVLFSVLVFFNTAVWTMAATLSPTRFAFALDIFLVIAAAFVVQGTIEHAKPTLIAATASSRHAPRLAGTPFAHMPDPVEVQPLTRAERVNVVLTLRRHSSPGYSRLLSSRSCCSSWWASLCSPLSCCESGLSSLPMQLCSAVRSRAAGVHQHDVLSGRTTFMHVSARSVGDGETHISFLIRLSRTQIDPVGAQPLPQQFVSEEDADQEPGINSIAPYPVDQLAESELDSR